MQRETIKVGISSGSFMKNNWHWLVVLVLVCFNFWQIKHHVLWRDEMQHWLIAAQSRTLPELWANLELEAQAGMWHLLLWCLSKISMNPVIMQFVHFAIGTATVVLVMRSAPFPRLIRMLVVMGYYFSFEYLLISRNYVLGVFLVVLFCSLYEKVKQQPTIGGIVLGVLANTSIFGAVISLSLLIGLLIDKRKEDELSPEGSSVVKKYYVTLISVYMMLFLGIVLTMLLRQSPDLEGWHLTVSVQNVFEIFKNLASGLAPVPVVSPNFWNYSYISTTTNQGAALLISLMVFCCALCALARTHIGLLAFMSGVGLMGTMQYVKWYYTLHHSGHAFILFVACMWLGTTSWRSRLHSPFIGQISLCCCILLLSVNVCAAGIAAFFHATRPFSGSKRMAGFMSADSIAARPVVAHLDYAATSVSGYLGKSFFMVGNRKYERFIRWNKDRQKDVAVKDILECVVIVAQQSKKNPLVLLNYPESAWKEYLIHSVDGSIVVDENFYLYDIPVRSDAL
jgi:hypothetical protein